MDLSIKGKRAVVTGSTAGIGLAIAARLAREGARVVISGRTQARVDQAIAALQKEVEGAVVEGVAADLEREDGVAALIERVPEADILVNNVGAYEAKPLEELTASDFRRLFDVNVLSGALLARHHLPRMLARGDGRVVFIASESGVQIPVEMIHYGVSKAAQIALARGLAERTRGTRVTVNSVLAGPTRSEGVERFITSLSAQQGVTVGDLERDFFKHARGTSLLGRFLDPEEIASVVAFLASPAASAINGASVRAEGGVILSAF